jgi:hypothetical protein
MVMKHFAPHGLKTKVFSEKTALGGAVAPSTLITKGSPWVISAGATSRRKARAEAAEENKKTHNIKEYKSFFIEFIIKQTCGREQTGTLGEKIVDSNLHKFLVIK